MVCGICRVEDLRLCFPFKFQSELDMLSGSITEVVDVTAVRQYKVPGTLDRCDVVEFVLESFLGERRPLTRCRRKRGRRTVVVLSELPKVSVRVISTILNFVGHLVNAEGEVVLVANNVEHFDRCQTMACGSVRRCSFGWHDEQLTAQEYVAYVSREVSSNLDFMAEARRRPRPGVLHPTATDEKEYVGLQGEFVEAEDMDEVLDQDGRPGGHSLDLATGHPVQTYPSDFGK